MGTASGKREARGKGATNVGRQNVCPHAACRFPLVWRPTSMISYLQRAICKFEYARRTRHIIRTYTHEHTHTYIHRRTTQTQLEPHNRSRIGFRMLSSVEAMRFHCELRACSLSPSLPLSLSPCAWRSKNFRKLLLHERFGAARRQGTAKVVVKRKLRRLQKELGNVAKCIKNLQPA